MKYTDVLFSVKDGVATITLNRPREMNALSRNLCGELSRLMGELKDDPKVNVVIITGGTEIFSAGIDLTELTRLAPTQYKTYFEPIIEYYLSLYDFPKPMVAAVMGIALGGGFNLALACDFIIASETAIFAHPEVKFGLNPIFDPLWRKVGIAKAKQLAMTGEPIGAVEAERIGLVTKVLPPEKVMDAALDLSSKLADKSPKVLSMIKRISDLVPRLDRHSAVEYEVELSALLLSYEETRQKLSEILTSVKEKKG
jgi:enoyl-CoA hydratase